MKTDQLTAAEIARLPGVPRITPLQIATLDAKARTGRRYGVSVSKGRYVVSLVSFALNAKGETTGGASEQNLASFPVADVADVIAYLQTV